MENCVKILINKSDMKFIDKKVSIIHTYKEILYKICL